MIIAAKYYSMVSVMSRVNDRCFICEVDVRVILRKQTVPYSCAFIMMMEHTPLCTQDW